MRQISWFLNVMVQEVLLNTFTSLKMTVFLPCSDDSLVLNKQYQKETMET